LGTILAVALFYSGELSLVYLAPGAALIGAPTMLNRINSEPCALVGVALWACVLESRPHPTLAGVILALFIPIRLPPNLAALTTQASGIVCPKRRAAVRC
jgi:NhaA family Na+:H+ antiporter